MALQPCFVAQGSPNVEDCLKGLLVGPSIISINERVTDTSSTPYHSTVSKAQASFQKIAQGL